MDIACLVKKTREWLYLKMEAIKPMGSGCIDNALESIFKAGNKFKMLQPAMPYNLGWVRGAMAVVGLKRSTVRFVNGISTQTV